MDNSLEEMTDLLLFARKVAGGIQLNSVTIHYQEKGVDKSVTIDDPILQQLLKLSLIMVNNKHRS